MVEYSVIRHSSTRGEIWLINLPHEYDEPEQSPYPVVIVSSQAFNAMPVRIVVPLITWRKEFEGRIDKFRIEANERNGLDVETVADFLQVSSVSTDCFVTQTGFLDAEQVEEIVAGIVIAVDYRP